MTSDLLQRIDDSLPNQIKFARVVTASREERITLFNQYVSNMSDSGTDWLEGSFVGGLLTRFGRERVIRNASGQHANWQSAPLSAITWFGICAALFEGSNVLTGANCLGRRIVRDLDRLRSPFDLPQADLNVFEYRVMSQDATALEQVNVGATEAFRIEILPDVTTHIRRGNTERDPSPSDEYRFLADSLREIKYVVDRASRRLDRSAEPDSATCITTRLRHGNVYADRCGPMSQTEPLIDACPSLVQIPAVFYWL